jgi:hypothetical protein
MMLSVATAFGIAAAAALLQQATLLDGLTHPSLTEFRTTFMLVGLVGFLAAFGYRALPRNAGAAIVPHG